MVQEVSVRRSLGRYAIYDEIASGGMATVHIGRLRGPAGFSRTVAIKSMHAQYAKDPEFVAMFLDEARLAARIRHPNVVATLDVVALKGEIFLVMDYVQGESFSRLLRTMRDKNERVPAAIVSSIMVNILDGLHAAHEATDEQGEALHIIHRDVSPHNMMIGNDGIARVLDFGVAKAAARAQTTRDGQVKGKFAYMAPEQITRQKVDRRVDVFAAAIFLWEALVGERLFFADEPAAVVSRVMTDRIDAPSEHVRELSQEVDAVVLKGLSREREQRYASAAEMARALERALPPARPSDVAQWVTTVAGDILKQRAQRVAEIESSSSPPAAVPEGEPIVEQTHTGLSSASPIARRRRTSVFVVLGGVAVVCVLAALGVQRLRSSSVASPSTASAPPIVVASPPSAVAFVGATSAPSSSIVAPPPPQPSAHPTEATVATAPPRVRHATTSASTAARCDPPYTFDEQGVKHFKRGCL